MQYGGCIAALVGITVLGGAAPAAHAATRPASVISAEATVGLAVPTLLPDPIGTVQTVLSDTVSATTQALCTLTGNNTVCTLNVLSYGIRTDFVKPDGSHVVKITGAVVGLPALVDADNDLLGLPDVMVTLTPAGTSKYQLQIQRLLTAPAAMPASVDHATGAPGSSSPRR